MVMRRKMGRSCIRELGFCVLFSNFLEYNCVMSEFMQRQGLSLLDEMNSRENPPSARS